MFDEKNKEIEGIECDAVKCMYNKETRCVAGKIEVGYSDASSSSETNCRTFIEDEH